MKKNKIMILFLVVSVILIMGFLKITVLSSDVRTLTLNFLNGYSYNIDIDSKMTYGDLPIEDIKGYKFVGWSLEKDGKKLENTSNKISKNNEIYAIYVKKNYILTLDLDGGKYKGYTGLYTEEVYYEDSISLDVPEKSGYAFSNWSIEGEDSKIEGSKFTMGTSDTKLTAKYNPNTYNVYLDFNGGSYNGISNYKLEVVYDSSITLAKPKRDGYIFAGYKISGGEIKNGKFHLNVARNVTISAKWVLNENNISTQEKEVSITNDNEEKTIVTESNISEDYSTCVAYYYLMNSDGTDYVLDSVVTNKFDNKVDFEVPLIDYENFIKPSPYIIKSNDDTKNYEVIYKYDRKKFKLDLDGVEDYYYFGQRVKLNITYKTGYQFKGWKYDAGNIENDYYEMPACDSKVVSEYTPISYNITYDLKGATLDNKKDSYTILDEFTISEPALEGYEFIGWTYNNSTEIVKNVTIKNSTGSLHFIANFVPLKIDITFNYNNGLENVVKTYDYDDLIGELDKPSKDGYKFIGWYDDFGVKVTSEYRVLKKTTITARFSEIINYPTAVSIIEGKKDNNLVFDNTNDKNLRYVGSNPNNYVKFNNELWRIVGVFYNVSDSDNNTTPKVKIIRDSYLGTYSYDVSESNVNSGYGVNDWTNSKLNKLLNDTYYNSLDMTCYKDEEAYECGFKNNGLVNDKDLIADVNYSLGTNGNSYWVSYKAIDFYNSMKSSNSSKVCNSSVLCNDVVTRNNTWNGKLGLMYVSDYAYALGSSKRDICLNTPINNWWNNLSCLKDNWLYGKDEFTMNSVGSKYYAYRVFAVGSNLISSAASNEHYVRPTLYLKSTVSILSGDGTKENPYILGGDLND